ncbi:UDP-N-acetylmuramoyl-L-alanyl-D-glutamate--L-lysine ligase [Pelotomaculum schinkii]|uniref:UDP-N-acetylmuramoyl-L-alanyl-D-glutamate--2,6-diaminopimelate ligase n=1 Tax=Pelotomaculum schinkii TaxID=78350 RepID=A0A4Y7RA58_9FIRM|nr:UDP-N-acetylmuramoyl-L-alanyl-D-glutamate--2,6-diaminopimelate ligase [Pelotomaculum schinkii]TEB05834.1 UDP-N-acetylmuramoyl-L-alanyl-D-glutamate--L-lysine ligase [Pelotomaculum schinkii]
MLFQELLKSVEVHAADGPQNTVLTGITYDSRKVEPGFLFVAVQGFKHDGAEYIPQAVEKGAVAVVAQKAVTVPPNVAWALVADSRQALALMSASFYGNPSTNMRMVGVTGTNGKTTTTNLIASVLDEAGRKTGLVGTIHNRIGARKLVVSHTTPESTDLQELLHEMATEQVSDCVMEVSSHALALHRVDGCEFDTAVFTNLTQDHLDFHPDMQSYLEAKQALFRKLAEPGAKRGKCAVVNADDAYAGSIIEAAAGVEVYTYGIKTSADVRAEDIDVSARGVSFTVTGKWGRCPLDLRITGLFNVYNTLAAFTACAAMGIPVEVIKKALEGMPGVPGRFELVDAGQDFAVIVDYAHTPDGLENVLKTAREITTGKLITVFGCGGDRDRTKRPLMGRIAAGYSDYMLVTSDNPRTEAPLDIIRDIEKGLEPVAENNSYTVEPDRRRAIQLAVRMAQKGDVVVIAGKGHEDYQIIGTQKYPFDDRSEAAAALGALQA